MLNENETTIRLFKDGAEFCALLGSDLTTGEAGYGDTPGSALRALAGALDVNDPDDNEHCRAK